MSGGLLPIYLPPTHIRSTASIEAVGSSGEYSDVLSISNEPYWKAIAESDRTVAIAHQFRFGSSDETTSFAIIDIKPGEGSNSINPRSKGKITVAVMGTVTLDVAQINAESVHFAGATIVEKPNGKLQFSYEDVNSDGYADFVAQFNTLETSIVCGDGSASLMGITIAGLMLNGYDIVETTGCD